MRKITYTLFAVLAVAMIAFTTVAYGQGSAKNTTANPVQMFTPDPQYSANVTVGTKGKSSNFYTFGSGQTAFYVSCRSADGTIPSTVQLYLNADSTYPVLLGTSATYAGGVNNTGKGTKTTKLGFGAYTTSAAKSITCTVWGQ